MAKKSRLQVVTASNGAEFFEEPRAGWDPLDSERPARGRGRPQEREHKWTKNVQPKSPGQTRLMEAIDGHDITLALGPAGTGKTYVAVAKAVEALRTGKVKRIILARPAVEAGERIGFLPGDMQEKLDPYMRPLYDALIDRMAPAQLSAYMAEKVIEIAPIGFMRGRTLANSAVVVDEAQNATRGQLKMILTRLGFGSFMVITGDPDQSDLDEGDSGLAEVAAQLEGKIDTLSVVRLDDTDVVRHPTVRAILPLLVA